jgi:thiol:disulfide interchange protein
MKKIVLMLTFALSLWANEASKAAMELGYSNSYSEGMAKAKKEHKLMMLVLVRDGCHWCKKFENETLKDSGIKSKIDGFVKVLIDKNEPLPERFHTNFIPTTYFIDPKTEKSVWELAGFKESKDFQEDINAAKTEYKTKK